MLGWTGRDLPGHAGVRVTRTTWYGRLSRVAPGDRVLSVNGRPASEAAIRDEFLRAPVGDSLALTVARGDTLLALRVPVVRSSVSYAGYSWFRLLLVVTSWMVGMVLVAWHGRAPASLALGTALLLVGPVMVSVALPVSAWLMRAANTVCQYQAAAYRVLLPALLAHAMVLQRPFDRQRWLRSWKVWVPVYLAAFLLLGASTAAFRDPLAWTLPGPARSTRAFGGMAMEVLAAVASALALSRLRGGSGPLRWLAQSVLLYLLVGVVVSAMSVSSAFSASAVDMVRQLKSLGLLLLIATSAVYALSLEDGEPGGSRAPGRLSMAASVLLTGLFGFAVAGVGMVVHELELSPLAAEVLPFAAVFAAAIAFSPVLRWAREMVDRQMLARWARLETRVNAFSDQLAAELEPARIAHRVAHEVPALLGVTGTELVLAVEWMEAWGAPEGDGLRTADVDALHDELAAERAPGTAAAPVLDTGAALLGVLRITTRHPSGPDPAQEAAVTALARGIASALRVAEGYLRLRETERELADAERIASLGAMAGGLAHEIKNPLLGLKLGLHLLRRDGGDPDRVHRLEDEVGRIDDLVNGLLRFTRNDVAEDASAVDVAELVRGCVDALRPLAEDRSAVIREAYPEGVARVRATPGQLRLVVSNLVKNALDAVPDPGVVEVSVDAGPSGVVLRVGDNGPGIPAALRRHVFDLAFSTRPGGSGIGLAVARRETERMGGTLQVESVTLPGTWMRVELPLASG